MELCNLSVVADSPTAPRWPIEQNICIGYKRCRSHMLERALRYSCMYSGWEEPALLKIMALWGRQIHALGTEVFNHMNTTRSMSHVTPVHSIHLLAC